MYRDPRVVATLHRSLPNFPPLGAGSTKIDRHTADAAAMVKRLFVIEAAVVASLLTAFLLLG